MPSGSSKKDTKRARLQLWLDHHQPAIVDSATLTLLARDLHPISDTYLRQLLRESSTPLSAEVEGVVTSSRENAERTLTALAEAYTSGAREVRRLAIEAKTRLRMAIAREPDVQKKRDREEILLWVMTWLENPASFPIWLQLRKHAASR